MNKSIKKPVAIALGAAFLASSAVSGVVTAGGNPFVSDVVPSAYELSGFGGDGKGEGDCGEGNCGEGGDGSCGEGGDGDCGEGGHEGKGEQSCGEGRCG